MTIQNFKVQGGIKTVVEGTITNYPVGQQGDVAGVMVIDTSTNIIYISVASYDASIDPPPAIWRKLNPSDVIINDNGGYLTITNDSTLEVSTDIVLSFIKNNGYSGLSIGSNDSKSYLSSLDGNSLKVETYNTATQVTNTWTYSTDGTEVLPGGSVISEDATSLILSPVGSNYQWAFRNDGNLQLPIVASGNTAIGTAFNTNPPGHTLTLEHNGGVNDGSGGELKFDYGTAEIKVVKDAGITQTWTFDTDGTLTLPGGSTLVPSSSNIDLVAGTDGWAELSSNNAANAVWVDNSGAYVGTNWTGTAHSWTFGMNGVLSLPGIEDDSTAVLDFFPAAANNHIFTLASDWTLKLKARADGANEGHLWLEAGQNTKIKINGNGSTVDVVTSDGTTSNTWTFDNTGVLTIPSTVKSKTGNYYLAQSDTSTEMSWQAAVVTTSSNVYAGMGSDDNDGVWVETAKTDELGNWQTKYWAFGFDGKLTLPNTSTIEDIPDGIDTGGILLTVGSNPFKFETSGATQLPNGLYINYGSLSVRASNDYDAIRFSDDWINDSGSIGVDASYNMYLKSANNFYIKRAGVDRVSITPTDTILSGNVTFSGPVTFNGTATYVLTTNTVYTDNILELHTPPGGPTSEWTVDDGMDIGLRFHYYNGQNLNGGLVLANDTKYLEWYEYGVESNGNITGGVYGTFKTGKIELISLTSATSTLTGALKVAGGVGVGGSLYASALYDGNSRVVTQATLGNYGVSTITAGTDTVVSTATGSVRVWNNSTLQTVTDRGTTTTNAIYINNSTPSVSTLTGALRVVGGVGIQGSLYAGALNVAAGSTFGGSLTLNAGTANQIQYLNASKVLVGAANLTYDGTILTGVFAGSMNGTIGGTTPNSGIFTTLSATGITVISNAVAATNTSSGALRVAGGVGVGGSLYANGVYDGVLRAVTSVSPLSSTGINITNVISTGSSLSFTVSNTGVVTLAAGTDTAISTSSGSVTVWNTSTLQSVTGRGATTDQAISVTNTTAATNNTSGALKVTGGVGVSGSLYASAIYDNNSRVITTATIPVVIASTGISITSVVSTSTTFTVSNTGVLQLTGGADISVSTSTGNITINNTSTLQSVTSRGASSSNAINITNTTSATDTTTGALKVAGGVGVGGSLYATAVYDNSNRVVTAATAGTDTSVSVTNGNISIWNTSTLQSITGRGATTNQAISITNATSATDTTTGALKVTGGVGVGGSLYATQLYDNGNRVITAATLATAGIVSVAAGTGTAVSTTAGIVTVWSTATLQTVTSFGATTPSAITITNATASTGTTNGALTVTGGIGAGNAYVGSLNVTGVSTLTGNVTVSAGTANQVQYLNASKTLVGSSNLTFDGTTLTGAFSGPINGSIGGITPSTGAFTTVSATTISASGVTTISNTSASNSTATGALTVAGGVGVGGSLYAGNIYDNGNRVVTSVTPSNGSGITITSLVSTGTATSFLISNSGVITVTAGTDTAVSNNIGGTVRVWNTSTLQTISDRGSTTTNVITVNNSTSATSTTSGALIVAGGVGVGGRLYAGNIYDNDNRVVTSVIPTASTGINITSVVSIGTATSFTVSNTGVLQLTGGTDISVSTSTGNITINNTSTLQSVTNRGATTSNGINITNTASATTVGSGALVVAGGVGVSGKLYASNVHSANTATFAGPISLNNSVGSQGNLLTSLANNGSPVWSTNLTWDGLFINVKAQANYWAGGNGYYGGITFGNSVLYANTYNFQGGLGLASNGSFDGTDWKYLNPGYVTLYNTDPENGVHNWYMSEYGTTGQYISDNYQGDLGGWKQAMTLDNLGNLNVLGAVTSTGGFIDNTATPENSLLYKQSGYITGSSVFNISNDNFIRLNNLPNYWSDFASGYGAYTGIINGLQTFYSGLDGTNNNTGIWVNAGWNDEAGDGYRQVDGYVAAYAITNGNHNWQTGGYGLAGSSMSDMTCKMYLTNDGLLGIGTYTNLTARLTVNGTVKVSSTATLGGLIVNGTVNVSNTATLSDLIASNLTVNGSFSFSGNRYTTVVTSVTPSAGTGINITGVVSTGTATSFTVSNTGVLQLTGGTDISVSTSTGDITITNASTLQSVTDRGAITTNPIYIANAYPASSNITGALTVVGGVGVGGSLYANELYDNNIRVVTSVTPSAGTGINITGVVSTGTATSFTVSNTGVLQLTGGTDISVTTSTGNITVNNTSTLQSVTGRGASSSNAITITNATTATSTTTGALKVTGGIGAYNAYLSRLHVEGPTTFGGDVTFSGTATYVLSTNTVYTDNIVELHTHPGGVGTTWASDDGKDIGFRFHHYTTTDTNAALVLANDTKYLEWYGSGAESTASGVITGGTYGTFKTGSIIVNDSTTASNNSSGALKVTGGVGVGGSLYATALYDNNNRVITTISAGTDTLVSVSSSNVTVWNTGTLQSVTNRGADTSNAINITNTTSATNNSSGALKVTGGVGVGGSLYATALYDNNSRVLTSAVTTLTAGTDTVVTASNGAVTVYNNSTLQTITNRGAATSNIISITNATTATSTTTAALKVTGGIGANNIYTKNITVGKKIYLSTDVSSMITFGVATTGFSLGSNGFFTGEGGPGYDNLVAGFESGSLVYNGAESAAFGNYSYQFIDGDDNTAIGYSAMAGSYPYYQSNGSPMYNAYNTAVGAYALSAYNYNNSTWLAGDYNTAIGGNVASAGYGSRNVLVGVDIANSGTTAAATFSDNTIVGYRAGYAIETGNYNVFVGNYAGSAVKSGSNNVIIGNFNGNSSGIDLTSSSNRVVIADGAGNVRLWADNNGVVTITSNASTTSSTTGALIVNGGVSVGRNLYVAGTTIPKVELTAGSVSGAQTLIFPYFPSNDVAQFNLTSGSATSLTINYDNWTTETPYNGQRLLIRIKSAVSIATFALASGGTRPFRTVGVTLPASIAAGSTTYIGLVYNSLDTKWDVIAATQGS